MSPLPAWISALILMTFQSIMKDFSMLIGTLAIETPVCIGEAEFNCATTVFGVASEAQLLSF
jgi:hypothetical protein